MLLIETTTVPDGALPVAVFRDHLRMGSGFADEGAEDVLLRAFLRAALAAVEARTGKALFTRDFTLTLRRWRRPEAQALPVSPVTGVARIVRIDAIDSETDADAQTWRLAGDSQTPCIVARGALLPQVPVDGAVRIEFTAGYGPDWNAIPADIAQAVLMLAATHYEFRHEARLTTEIMPHGVAALLEPHRAVRVGLGGAG